MSMPSSSDEVATTHRSRPVLRSSSIRLRWSLDTEPWWARASTGDAPSWRLLCRGIAAGSRSAVAGRTTPPGPSGAPVPSTGAPNGAAWPGARPGRLGPSEAAPGVPGVSSPSIAKPSGLSGPAPSSPAARRALSAKRWFSASPTATGSPEPLRSPSGDCSAAFFRRNSWISLSRAVSFSASPREFANTMVERWASTRSTIRSSTCGQMDAVACPDPPRSPSRLGEPSDDGDAAAPPSTVMSGMGTETVRSQSFSDGGRTTSTGCEPPRNPATVSTGSTVAESPIRWAGSSSRSSRRSRLTARCAPRLVPATACTSSMITVFTWRRVSRALDVSMRYRDSGVVMRMSGGWASRERRIAWGVSPERTPTEISGGSPPAALTAWVMPISGARRLRSTSTPRALSGEM